MAARLAAKNRSHGRDLLTCAVFASTMVSNH